METDDPAKAAEEAFASIAKDAPKETKYAVMKAFAAKYGADALMYVRDEAFVAGYLVQDVEKMKTERPGEYTRLLSIAYALTLYKEDGFMAAIDLIRSGAVLRKEEAPQKLPALYFIASTAIMGMIDKGLVDKRKASSMLDAMINDPDTKPMEKALFLEFAVHMDPKAICAYKNSSIQAVKAIAEARFEEMEGVTC